MDLNSDGVYFTLKQILMLTTQSFASTLPIKANSNLIFNYSQPNSVKFSLTYLKLQFHPDCKKSQVPKFGLLQKLFGKNDTTSIIKKQ